MQGSILPAPYGLSITDAVPASYMVSANGIYR